MNNTNGEALGHYILNKFDQVWMKSNNQKSPLFNYINRVGNILESYGLKIFFWNVCS